MSTQAHPAEPDERLSPRVDLVVAAAFLAFAGTVVALALDMPTYRDQKGEIYTAPGLVPGFYAVIITVLSVALGARAALRARHGLGATTPTRVEGAATLAVVGALGVVFCTVLVGRMPFWLASAIFITCFIAIFEWPAAAAAPRGRWRRLGSAALQGLICGAVITLVFEKVFYVRLP